MGTYGKLMSLNQGAPHPDPDSEKVNAPVSSAVQKSSPDKKRAQRRRDTMPPRNHATVVSRYHDTTIEAIRSAVKDFGKEAATHRFTVEEKKTIRDIVYAYVGQGIRTNENEVTRIGVNFLIEDYRTNGDNSILQKVLKALNG